MLAVFNRERYKNVHREMLTKGPEGLLANGSSLTKLDFEYTDQNGTAL